MTNERQTNKQKSDAHKPTNNLKHHVNKNQNKKTNKRKTN